MKFAECLPDYIADEVTNVADVREIRIRNNSPVRLNAGGRWYYLGTHALLTTPNKAICAKNDACDEIVKTACRNSIYAHEKSLANGYFTFEDGARMGVCGHVYGLNAVVFQKYTSVCFRIPHRVNCVSVETLERCRGHNVLVIGAPSTGKTTFLRDLAAKLAQSCNVLVIDERGELFYDDGEKVNCECDVLKWADKSYALTVGVRSMSPQYVVCDELTEKDTDFALSCINSGVHLVCSAHGYGEQDFDNRFGLLSKFEVVFNLNNRHF